MPDLPLDSRQYLRDILLTMTYPYFNAELLMQMLGQMLGGIDAAETAARTSESKHQVSKPAPEITRHMGICQFVDTVQERQNLSVLFLKTDYRSVQTRQGFVRFIPSGIVRAAAIEHITASVPVGVFGNPFLIGETEHAHDQRSPTIVPGNRSRPDARTERIGSPLHSCVLSARSVRRRSMPPRWRRVPTTC